MKKYTNTAHPDIFKSVRLLQREEAKACLKYEHAKGGGPVPPRRKNLVYRDNQFKFYKRLIEKKQIALKSYIDNLVEADFDFSNKQKKKSSKEPSTEGEESDSGNEIVD